MEQAKKFLITVLAVVVALYVSKNILKKKDGTSMIF